MSQTRCPNNIMLSCPALMEDGGRGITDYRSRYEQNHPSNFPGAPKNMTSYEYAQFIRDNGEAIMENERRRVFTMNSCGPRMCQDPQIPPPKNKLQCDSSKCTLKVNDPEGYGMIVDSGYDLYNMDDYVGHSISRHIDLNPMFYPLDGDVKDEYPRLASPRGGVPLHPTIK